MKSHSRWECSSDFWLVLLAMFLISGVSLSEFGLVNYRKDIVGVCLSDPKLVIDLESSLRGMFFQFDISEILGVYEDVGYVFLGVYPSLCQCKQNEGILRVWEFQHIFCNMDKYSPASMETWVLEEEGEHLT